MLEQCSKSEFADFVRDFNLKVEMDIAPDCVGMRYVNRDGVVCASSMIDLRSGAESDWKILRGTASDIEPLKYSNKRGRYGPRSPRSHPDSVLVDSYLSGNSVKTIHEKYGVPEQTVYRILKKSQNAQEYRSLTRKSKRSEILEAYLSGASIGQIAHQHDVSRQRISKILTSAGYRRGDRNRR